MTVYSLIKGDIGVSGGVPGDQELRIKRETGGRGSRNLGDQVLGNNDRNPKHQTLNPYLSSILGDLKVNLWDPVGIIVPQKG